ncbi:hypothetical protein ACU686_18200 [Yinghuangia aomiensis]
MPIGVPALDGPTGEDGGRDRFVGGQQTAVPDADDALAGDRTGERDDPGTRRGALPALAAAARSAPRWPGSQSRPGGANGRTTTGRGSSGHTHRPDGDADPTGSGRDRAGAADSLGNPAAVPNRAPAATAATGNQAPAAGWGGMVRPVRPDEVGARRRDPGLGTGLRGAGGCVVDVRERLPGNANCCRSLS